jgi:YVTN family beta-propeller protein
MTGIRAKLINRTFRLTRVILVVFAFLGVGVGDVAAGAPGHTPGASGTLWVTNRTGALGSVTAFDAGTLAVIDTITVGSKPTAVLRANGTDKVYVSNGSPSNSVSVISRDSLSVIATIDMGAGTDPHHMTQSPDGRAVYVALFGTNKVAVIDTATDTFGTVEASEKLVAKTHAVWAGNDGTLYATNSLGSSASSPPGTVSAIDVSTGSLLWEVVVGPNPSEVLVTDDGKTAYVTVRAEDAVRVLDLTADPPTVSPRIPIGAQPDTLQLTNDHKTLVVALRGAPAVTLMDTVTLETRTVTLEGRTTTGHQWLSANGHHTFVAVVGPSGRSGVDVIDNRTAEVVSGYEFPGVADPHGVFFEPSRLR